MLYCFSSPRDDDMEAKSVAAITHIAFVADSRCFVAYKHYHYSVDVL